MAGRNQRRPQYECVQEDRKRLTNEMYTNGGMYGGCVQYLKTICTDRNDRRENTKRFFFFFNQNCIKKKKKLLIIQHIVFRSEISVQKRVRFGFMFRPIFLGR
jgi:hypothetical protein